MTAVTRCQRQPYIKDVYVGKWQSCRDETDSVLGGALGTVDMPEAASPVVPSAADALLSIINKVMP
jgi:hypothetical protein